jgi:hypothetical protein
MKELKMTETFKNFVRLESMASGLGMIYYCMPFAEGTNETNKLEDRESLRDLIKLLQKIDRKLKFAYGDFHLPVYLRILLSEDRVKTVCRNRYDPCPMQIDTPRPIVEEILAREEEIAKMLED